MSNNRMPGADCSGHSFCLVEEASWGRRRVEAKIVIYLALRSGRVRLASAPSSLVELRYSALESVHVRAASIAPDNSESDTEPSAASLARRSSDDDGVAPEPIGRDRSRDVSSPVPEEHCHHAIPSCVHGPSLCAGHRGHDRAPLCVAIFSMMFMLPMLAPCARRMVIAIPVTVFRHRRRGH